MRSTLLVIVSCLVLVTAFLVYSHFQSGGSQNALSTHAVQPPPAIPKAEPWTQIRPGEHPWFISYGEDGVMKNRFRSDDYKPQTNGRIDVTNPIAEFFLPNHQLMRLTGKTGDVVMPETPHTSQNSTDSFAAASPERGEIRDVTIEIFNMFPDSDPKVPDETITTNNIQFDNATRLITTESYTDPAGQKIARDEVPVHMRSNNDHHGYDFDGKGLSLRWNDTDGRLDLLQVEHGEDLIVKDTSSASGVFGGGGKPAKTSASAPAASAVSGAAPVASEAATAPAPQLAGARLPGQKPDTASETSIPPAAPVPYVATFYDNVSITQGDDILVTANRMDLDFVSRQKREAAPLPATRPTMPATVPTSEPSPTEDANLVATTKPAASQPVASAAPTSRPSAPPVVIRWTGRLVMLSAQPDRPKVTAGDAIVELSGDPVTVRRTPTGQQEGDDVRAARLVYHTGDGSVKLVNSKTVEHVVISKLIDRKIDPTSTVTTSTLDYMTDSNGRKVAVLTGPGHASMPMQAGGEKSDDPKKAATEMMDTHWEKEARVYFIGKGQDEQAVDHVDLVGDVDVKHPQLAMNTQALSLFFAPPNAVGSAPPGAMPGATETVRDDSSRIAGVPPVSLQQGHGRDARDTANSPEPADRAGKRHGAKSGGDKPQQELRRVVAKQDVHCVMAGQNGKSQTIDCDELEMQTARSADGKFYARQVNARGSVHAFDPDQDLRAGTVELTLKPAIAKPKAPATQVAQTRPVKADSETAAAELEKMDARENVSVKNKEGSIATGSELIVTTEGDQNHVRLIGSPLATVIDAKNNTIVGPLIIVEQGVAHVVGAGNMHVLQEQGNGAKPRPMDVAWLNRADMNGKANRVDISGGVSVTTYDADGTVNVASGDVVQIDLMDKPAPATRPATRPTTRPAQNAAAPDAMQMDVMKDKDAQRITIDGKAQVVSTLRASDGAVARQFALYGPKIIYQLLDSKELPAATLLVPSAGRMYVGDHRPPEKVKASGKPDAAEDESGGRGDTAFQWSKQLVYGQSQRQAVITGDVLVVHQPIGKQADEDRVRINADQMTALFEPQKKDEKPAAAPQSAKAPDTQPARIGQAGESLQLKHLTADGHVVISRANGSTLYADRVDFEPLTHWMLAHGSDRNPARYVDADANRRPITAQDMQWNTQTWNLKMSDPRAVNPK